jgi:hypothetical protein
VADGRRRRSPRLEADHTAKGGSVFAAEGLKGQVAAGQDRRAVAATEYDAASMGKCGSGSPV